MNTLVTKLKRFTQRISTFRQACQNRSPVFFVCDGGIPTLRPLTLFVQRIRGPGAKSRTENSTVRGRAAAVRQGWLHAVRRYFRIAQQLDAARGARRRRYVAQ